MLFCPLVGWAPGSGHNPTARCKTPEPRCANLGAIDLGGRMPRNIAIGLGLMEFPFDGVAGFWRWVDLCEAGGIDSLWQTDRMVSREPILECMSVMSALAGRTRRLKFGVNVLSLAFRDPVLLAKQCATIDVLSEGRLLPAFGIGSPLAPESDTQPRHQDPRPQDR